jgi:DNA-binding response OmpR family regulator
VAYKILIVDDETMLTELLSSHLQKCGYTAFVAEDAEQAISMLNIYPDLILLDINMPEMDGLELCKIIRNHVTCPILFLTARITEQDKVNGLQAGGDDYITKPFSLQELTARVAAHLRREARGKYIPKIVSSQGLIVNLAERKIFYGEMEMNLSNREFDIVEFLTSNANQIFDKERIYEAVWGFNAEGNSGVIKEHIRKIRNKLKEATGREYIETVWGMGYRWKK